MPKGGDLHNHLSGAVYAESYIQWAAEKGLCVNTQTMTLSQPTQPNQCDPTAGQAQARSALTNRALYEQMIDAWSMRNWSPSATESGHDHFFNTFSKFGPATWGQTGKMLAEAVSRAARGKVLYLELMLTPDGGVSSQIGDKVGWDGDLKSTLNKLKANDIDNAVAAAMKNLGDAEKEKNQLLKCGTRRADPGCSVTVRYIAQVGRTAELGPVYAQMVTGFMLGNDPNSKVVGLNLVQPEDAPNALNNFSEHMRMLKFLQEGSRGHLTLHAGELVPGLVTDQKNLTFHIRDSVKIAGAERIGHGVDIMHENDWDGLLKEMATRGVLVEICLSSNDLILGVKGKAHPLSTYLKYEVPVALATDDAGVARSEISNEYLKAAEEQGLGYLQLKTMARNSLQYSFVSGDSLWSDGRKFTSVGECRRDLILMKLTSSGCRQFLESSEKAKLQWRLEEQFREFERRW
ncbi:MAG TPA: hypothetical protein VFX97_19135 [Pyrinomonadaceae bacterium]|nr:hypothetical protein [Pyrinomonadaceae bacterium]